MILLRNSKINPRKTSEELKKDFDKSGVHVSSSTVRRRLLEKSKETEKAKNEATVNRRNEKETIQLSKKHKDWSEDDWSRVLFSDESHFFVQGFNPKFVRCSPNEKLREEHFVQTVKHSDKKMFWGCFFMDRPRLLVPFEGMMNSKAYLQIIERKVCTELSDLHPCAIF